MELPRVGRRLHRIAALLAALLALLSAVAGSARAEASGSARTAEASQTSSDPNAPVLITSENRPPAGYRLTAAEVRRIALRAPSIGAELRRHRRARAYEYTKGPGRWQVSWFSPGPRQEEIAQVYVDDATGRVTEAWTGFQVAWTMARGYPGAFGRRVNAAYVWLPLCLLFAAPFVPWRRLAPGSFRAQGRSGVFRRGEGEPGGRGGWSLLHLDLAVLLAFSVSLAFFNHARIGLSVPLVYPGLLYLLVRMLLLAGGRGRPRAPLSLHVPASWLAVAVIFLVGFRVGLNVTNSNVIDVGYAGVIGAEKLLQGKPLYGHWPRDNANGDTYGPTSYYAYLPFTAVLGWSGNWDALPAAHAAAIAFDLLTLLGLYLLGRRIRGPTTGTVLAYLWVSYPFTLFTLSSNTNDSLVALLVVAVLLSLAWAPVRGVAGALAGMTKFAPLALGPLLLRGCERPRARSGITFVLSFLAMVAVAMAPVLVSHDLGAFWRDSISYQAARTSPFSVWGLWGGLSLEQHLVQGAGLALAVAVMFVPRGKRSAVEVSALGAAVLILLQLGASYWLYPYLMWFLPLVLVALVAGHPAERAVAAGPPADEPARDRRPPPLVPAAV